MCELMDGVEWRVPVVIAEVGIIDGTYYPAAALAASVPYWWDIPVMIGNQPRDEYGWLPLEPLMGVVRNARTTPSGKLIGELWLWVEWDGPWIVNPGIDTTAVAVNGKWDGDPYTQAVQTIIPHHLELNWAPASGLAMNNAAALVPQVPLGRRPQRPKMQQNTERGRCWAQRTSNVWTEKRQLLVPRK